MRKFPLVLSLIVALLAARSFAQDAPQAQPPEGAVVLFDGSDLSKWKDRKSGGEPKWNIVDDAMEVNGGDIETKDNFQDFELHVEFMTPQEPKTAKGQHRGNSGVYLQGRYEIQVLESYGEEPHKQGCGAIYMLKAPDENVSRPPGQWQSYDIKFRAARFDEQGNKTENARVSVVHNGVQIHNNVEIPNTTGGGDKEAAPGTGPLRLQDHGHKVRYRNVWIVPSTDKE